MKILNPKYAAKILRALGKAPLHGGSNRKNHKHDFVYTSWAQDMSGFHHYYTCSRCRGYKILWLVDEDMFDVGNKTRLFASQTEKDKFLAKREKMPASIFRLKFGAG